MGKDFPTQQPDCTSVVGQSPREAACKEECAEGEALLLGGSVPSHSWWVVSWGSWTLPRTPNVPRHGDSGRLWPAPGLLGPGAAYRLRGRGAPQSELASRTPLTFHRFCIIFTFCLLNCNPVKVYALWLVNMSGVPSDVYIHPPFLPFFWHIFCYCYRI